MLCQFPSVKMSNNDFSEDGHRHAWRYRARSYAEEDEAKGRNPPTLWSLAADKVREELYVKLCYDMEQLFKKGPDHREAAFKKVDEVVAAFDEPRGSFSKVAARLHAATKTANTGSNKTSL